MTIALASLFYSLPPLVKYAAMGRLLIRYKVLRQSSQIVSLIRKVSMQDSWAKSMHIMFPSSRKQSDPARGSTNLANLTNLADLSLKFRMIFRTVKRTGDSR